MGDELHSSLWIRSKSTLLHCYFTSSIALAKSALETTLNMDNSCLFFKHIHHWFFAFWNRVLDGWQHQNPLSFWHLKNKLNLCSNFFFKLYIFNYNTYGFVNSKCKLVLVLDSSMFSQTIIISLYFNKSNSNNCWC